jgi:phage FluMu protein Com
MGYCPHCGSFIPLNYFLVYFQFNAYFVAICPECKELAREKLVKEGGDNVSTNLSRDF